MLQIFRKYQRYIFIFITIVIVISFSFFGTYSAMQNSSFEDPTAFIAVDGTHIKRSELEKMNIFIGTDLEEKRNYGGVWGPNFLNDGVVKKEFLETGIAQVILEAFSSDIKEDLSQRHNKEKQYQPYAHPQANFISTEAAWNYFLPGMKQNYSTLKNAKDPLSSEAFDARVKLFLGQRRFPAPMLRNMLRMQEKQYNWIEHDQTLDYADFSLYGYHRAEDWFGPSFMRLAGEFIINSAIIAKQRGYSVTESEAYADLIRNASISFKQNQQSPHLNVGNVGQYMNEQLRRMSMDKKQAVRLWQQVLLFRRLYQDIGNSMFTDPFTFQEYNAYTFENVSGTLYQLSPDLRFSNERSFVKFELYLDGVSDVKSGKDRFKLPDTFKKAADVAKSNPELVQKRYLVDVSEVNTKQLESKVGLKQMWSWETDDSNWKVLSKEFPELALTKAKTPEERQKALDDLDKSTRARVDDLARASIVKKHPEWVENSLNEVKPETKLVNIPLKGGHIDIKGVSDRSALINQLDTAPLASEEDNSQPLEYSGDEKHYYRIHVINRSDKPEVMTYAEANDSGVLDEMADQQLKKQYEKIRSKHPKDYKNDDGTWKNFDSVADSVAGRTYDPIIKEMGERFVAGLIPKDDAKDLSMSRAASLRFLQHVTDAKASLKSGVTDEAAITKTEVTGSADNEIPLRQPLAEQWKLTASPYSTKRSSQDTTLDKQEALSMKEGDLSKVYTPNNGDLYFFAAEKRGHDADKKTLSTQVYTMHRLLGFDAQRTLAEDMLAFMQKRKALNVDFLKMRQNKVEDVEDQPQDD
jgi:GcvH upstream region-like protein